MMNIFLIDIYCKGEGYTVEIDGGYCLFSDNIIYIKILLEFYI